MNIYKEILIQNKEKLLNLYNLDSFSSTYGFGDREYWGWKIKDFANGSMQGGVHSLAIGIRLGIFENESFILHVIDAAIKAIPEISAKNGSMVEAFPAESSFCVTAIVAFDVLSAIKTLEDVLTDNQKQEYIEIIKPLINFINKNNEEHAIVSNHIATAAAAMALWNYFTGEGIERYNELLQIIYNNQNNEGWYREYEGADPGYQTLCTYYLFSAYETTNDKKLLDSLSKSISFLKYFIHPDGTLGGLYGSRNTEVYYPAGVIGLAKYSEEALAIKQKLEKRIQKGNNISPQNIDIGNYIPLLNSYAKAALYAKEYKCAETNLSLPFSENFSKLFNDAGIYIHSNENYYAIVNYKKGGTIKVFNKQTNSLDCEDGGIFGKLSNGVKFSTQQMDDSINFDNKEIKTYFYKINDSSPTMITTITLRILGLTIFRSIFLNNIFKKIIVKALMTGKNKLDGHAIRKFLFNEDSIIIEETIQKPKKCMKISHPGKVKSIHMASSRYYLKQHQNLINQAKLLKINISEVVK